MQLSNLIKDIKTTNRSVLIYGLGLSGIEAALALSRLNINCAILEERSRKDFLAKSKYADRLPEVEAVTDKIFFQSGSDLSEIELENFSLCLQSPGISFQSPFTRRLQEKNIRVSNELEFGLSFFDTPSIIVTGSVGKSTVCSLTHQLLESAGKKSLLCGNIGDAISTYVPTESTYDYLVVEASSYQLESSSEIHAHIAVLLNVMENHLERHGTIEELRQVKERVFRNQEDADFAIYPEDDLRHSIDTTAFSLPGNHNLHNLAVAIRIVSQCGISKVQIEKALPHLKSLEHRLETVPCKSGIVINDSKATTANSTLAALYAVLETHPSSPVHLLCGGLAKEGDEQKKKWGEVFSRLSSVSIGTLTLFGEDGEQLADLARSEGLSPEVYVSMTAAAQASLASLSEGKVLLFSPGCASFDEFTDFGQRGNVFKSLISS